MERPAHDSIIPVFIADSQAVIRSGVRLAIEEQPDLAVVGEADDLPSALAQIESKRPAVAVVELNLSSQTGVEVTRILARKKDLDVVYLSSEDDPGLLAAATRAGARAILAKNAPMCSLIDAIRAVHAEPGRHPAKLGAQLEPGGQREDDGAWADLTPREREVAGLVAQGLPYREVAGQLRISDHTVKNHLRRIYDKLDINSRVELAVHGAGR